ncbi:membrane hypothetical protein [Vibrio harveyi]|uniref:hypothetical protein n=1 Tax=Vibrio harveyi TaxID=669 RepID=UPI002AD67DFC|nr:hypothetical protein [Vibrio harveyi]CAK6712089.1 membrane hypothetical protein [Vibrio harveyi]
MMQFFPGFYYFSSRFDSLFSGFNYFFKYWFSYIVVFLLISYEGEPFAVSTLLAIVTSLCLFYCSYDVLCFKNDTTSVKYEKGTGVQRSLKNSNYSVFSPLRVIIFCCLTLLLYTLLGFSSFILSFGSLVILILSFFLHNNIRPSLRVYTFFILYFLKPFIVGGWLIINSEPTTLVFFSLVYALCYLPNYAKRKLENGKIKSVLVKTPPFFTSGIFLKVLFISPFLFFNFDFIYFILIQIIMTSIEVVNNKRLVVTK